MWENSTKGTKVLYGGPPKTPLLALEGDTGWLHPSVSRYVELLRFWNKVLKEDDNIITCRLFDYDYKLCKGNWCYEIKQWFSNITNNMIYDEKMICNIYELQQYIDDKWKEK